jgi:hypothetical protein
MGRVRGSWNAPIVHLRVVSWACCVLDLLSFRGIISLISAPLASPLQKHDPIFLQLPDSVCRPTSLKYLQVSSSTCHQMD